MMTSLTRGAANHPTFTKALDQQPDQLTQVLCTYWDAVAERWPTAIKDGKAYSLRGTQRLYSLHAIFPDVLEACRNARDYSKANMVTILNRIDFDDDFWSRDEEVGHPLTQSTSMAVLRRLAHALRNQLPEVALPGF